ncbi:glutamine-hydrolyzing carbamoyl-phosphate synthase small subunit [Patescibacteria group bacterium]|nr:glutamine-hydrolyzing carbamoyl-phosphate synthase small subunit [Patescibacteria group bacterium]MCL5010309.1 glutamine-hydrolyzing carbamoyl-phosphate synthase small subunit [Patescibacteria group bacterium]
MKGTLILEDGSHFEGLSFGFLSSSAGEVVFSTGMVGYPQSLTDPSYKGQILILTYPIIGNYGVADKKYWESEGIKAAGLIVSNYIDTPSHFLSKETLSDWLKREKIPAIEINDTRFLTQKIREKGTMLGKIVIKGDIEFYDPNKENLLPKVCANQIRVLEPEAFVYHAPGPSFAQNPANHKKITVLLIDCGAKRNIIRSLLKRGVRVITVPWDRDPFSDTQPAMPRTLTQEGKPVFDAIVVSNGPGNPQMADKTINTIAKALKRQIPILGICLGHQLLTLALGGGTGKLKYGHRSQNQPCILSKSKKCFITTQNHGFYVNRIPNNFRAWFTNANDGTNEGIIHKNLPIMSVQFHPEANPGPMDTEWVFDYFLERLPQPPGGQSK